MTTTQELSETDEFAERVFEAALGTLDLWAMFVGDKLDLYETLAENGALSRNELSARTGMNRRYAHEWLEQQVTTGILSVDDPSLGADDRRYSLSPGKAEVLTDKDSLAYLAPFVRLLAAGGIQLPKLLEAYKTGGGVSWEEFGDDMRTGQAEMNRPWFLKELGTSWFPAVPDLHARLEAGARVADVGCGEGWSSIGIAQAYPEAHVDGYDIDTPSIEAARRHAAAAGLSDRVQFHSVDASTLDHAGSYEVVTAFECIHDLPDPIGVLTTMRQLAASDGQIVVMDESVGDSFGERTDEVERLMYGFSLFICLPDGMSHEGSVATGTVIRRDVMERYALEAGFSGIEVLPIENDLWRFYQLNN